VRRITTLPPRLCAWGRQPVAGAHPNHSTSTSTTSSAATTSKDDIIVADHHHRIVLCCCQRQCAASITHPPHAQGDARVHGGRPANRGSQRPDPFRPRAGRREPRGHLRHATAQPGPARGGGVGRVQPGERQLRQVLDDRADRRLDGQRRGPGRHRDVPAGRRRVRAQRDDARRVHRRLRPRPRV